VLFGFLVLAHDRRRVVHFNVTTKPTLQWTAQHVVVLGEKYLRRILGECFRYYRRALREDHLEARLTRLEVLREGS
jgi:hypothetical protein